MLEGVAARRARSSIRDLATLLPETARLEEAGGTREVPAAELALGSIIQVRPGDRIAADVDPRGRQPDQPVRTAGPNPALQLRLGRGYVRYYNLPIRWKHSLTFGYTRGNWSHNLSQLHRDGYYDELPPSVANGSYIPAGWKPRVEGYTTYDYSIT